MHAVANNVNGRDSGIIRYLLIERIARSTSVTEKSLPDLKVILILNIPN